MTHLEDMTRAGFRSYSLSDILGDLTMGELKEILFDRGLYCQVDMEHSILYVINLRQ